jgi:hypothetical protein
MITPEAIHTHAAALCDTLKPKDAFGWSPEHIAKSIMTLAQRAVIAEFLLVNTQPGKDETGHYAETAAIYIANGFEVPHV